MRMFQDTVEVQILPDNAKCIADNKKRSPLDISDCPISNGFCDGDCPYYAEED